MVYSCVSAAWYDGRCLFNRYNGICRFGSLALISFIACVALLLLEIFFSHISSIKVRRRIAIGDVIVSSKFNLCIRCIEFRLCTVNFGHKLTVTVLFFLTHSLHRVAINTVFFLLLFVFLAIGWLKSDYPPYGHSINCCRVAILLSFLAIFALAACTGLAYVRYQSGVDMSQFMTEEQLAQEQAQYYDESGNYQGAQYTVDDQAGGYAIGNGSQYAQTGPTSYVNYDTDFNLN